MCARSSLDHINLTSDTSEIVGPGAQDRTVSLSDKCAVLISAIWEEDVWQWLSHRGSLGVEGLESLQGELGSTSSQKNIKITNIFSSQAQAKFAVSSLLFSLGIFLVLCKC